MTSKVARRGEFAQFVAYHVFRNKDGNEGFAIVYCDGFADHVGNDHRRARPGFDHGLFIALFRFQYLFEQLVEYVRSFFD